MAEGRIIKAISGFYYVQSSGNVYQCRGRGIFRKQKITPFVGDFVEFEAPKPDEGYILAINPRQNKLIRPPVANIDQVILVSSADMPEFKPLLLDRFLVSIEAKKMKPVIFLTKQDLIGEIAQRNLLDYQTVYEQIGYFVELISGEEQEISDRLRSYLTERVSVMAGQSGVGKSSLLNSLNPSLQLATGDISMSLGRGKHITRHVELVEAGGGLVADTPGFSTLDFADIEADELRDCFPEIRHRQGECKFRSCLHNHEPQCAVKKAVENGDIASSRYEHYLRFLEEIYSRKPRY
ncbi:ribosome small subunit-dependent GTPase A [Barrientosiimonas marina]|uniref:Small ribosomal subunit biogenesis GTPase RsgA n=1 Tax=Lentibacillus kimchii TaxID=1542911 RepID=A0ABW2URL5_9BACI